MVFLLFVFRIENLEFFFCRTLAAFIIFGECAKVFQQLMWTPLGQNFKRGRRDIIPELQDNKMQKKFFACPTGKYHSAYSPFALNELNLPLSKYCIGTE
jgi:hypothetical protein